jgi:hypothetical protein
MLVLTWFNLEITFISCSPEWSTTHKNLEATVENLGFVVTPAIEELAIDTR